MAHGSIDTSDVVQIDKTAVAVQAIKSSEFSVKSYYSDEENPGPSCSKLR